MSVDAPSGSWGDFPTAAAAAVVAAAAVGDASLVADLLHRGATSGNPQRFLAGALAAASRARDVALVRHLLGQGADLAGSVGERHSTALLLATGQDSNAAVVQTLLDAGADVNK